MLSVEEARDRLLAGAEAVTDMETVDVFDAGARVLAADLAATIDVPPMDNAQMDGYAVRSAELADLPGEVSREFPISQRIAAGHVGAALAAGTVARIFTGAPMPPGADAVVMQEAATVIGDGRHVRIGETPRPGQWIRRRGSDIAAGSIVLHAGRRLQPQDLGLAASIGKSHLAVRRRLRVATVFTGDELVMPGEPLPPGRIYNSNRFMLRGLLNRLGCDVVDHGIVRDSLEATRAALTSAARTADLIITSGGVSVGDEDHVKAAVQADGRLDSWQIAMKPGKPLAFGQVHGVPLIGLPGNPVSAFVTFLLLARPFILRRQGAADPIVATRPVRADFDLARADKRREFLRVRLNADGGAELFANQNSAVLSSCVWADGLVDNPAGQTIARGATVAYLPFAELFA